MWFCAKTSREISLYEQVHLVTVRNLHVFRGKYEVRGETLLLAESDSKVTWFCKFFNDKLNVNVYIVQIKYKFTKFQKFPTNFLGTES